MKVKRFAKSTLSIILSLLMVMSVIFASAISAYAADASITYNFTGDEKDLAGYAQGTVTFTGVSAGTYYLYWADDTKALDGYYPIAEMTVTAGGSDTFTFGDHTAIPAGATKIIATTSKTSLAVSSAVATYNVPASKQLSAGSGDKLYNFSSYSDVHIDPEGYYQHYTEYWTQALEFSAKKGADFIVSSGDMVNYGREEEWDIYLSILADSSFDNPVYESNGNHDLRADETAGTKNFVTYSGTDNTIANYDANKPYYAVTEKSTGDLFIFMAWESYKGYETGAFSDEQLAWASELLEENYGTGKNIYLIEHAPIEGFGAGDRMENPYYKALLKQDQLSNVKFKSLVQKYPEVIWMSGHTHIDFQLDYNYSNEDDTACHMIHNPAVVGSTWVNSTDDGLEYNNGSGYNSQGYLVEVYENTVVYYGANLTEELYYPAYCYIMDGARNTSADDVNETDPITTSPTTPKTYALPGSFNSWSTSANMEVVDDTHVALTYQLSAGTYEFKIYDGSSWYGNTGTIDDTTTTSSTSGWTMSSGVSNNCTLNATGGYYTFTLDTTTMKVVVEHSTTAPSTETTPTTAPTTAPTTTPTTPSSELSQYEMGDVNRDGELNIQDVTAIQRYLAKLDEFDDEQVYLADYNESGNVSIKDATKIQCVLLGYTDKTVADTGKAVNSVGASTLSEVLTSAQTQLAYYTFASYDQYQAVKKMYNTYKDASSASSDVIADFESKISDFQEISTHIGVPTIYPVGDTYYFVNTQNWSVVNGYAWSSSSNATWPGVQLEVCGTYNGYDVYGIKFASAGQYKNLIFNNGTAQTVDIALSEYSGNCFMLSTMTDGKYTVTNFDYTDATSTPTTPGTDGSTTDTTYALRYYHAGTHDWDAVDTYLTPQADGTYKYTYTTTDSGNVSVNVYNTTNGTWYTMTANDERSVYYDATNVGGTTSTFTFTTATARNKTITVYDLAEGVTITFVFNPTTQTMTVTV